MSLPGITREHPNFRTAPHLDSEVIRVLSPGTALEVFQREGEYFAVAVDGQRGYIHVDFVLPNPGGGEEPRDTDPARPGDTTSPHLDVPSPPPPVAAVAGSLAAEAAFASAALEPPAGQQVNGGGSLVRVWNQYGGLIDTLSRYLGIDPAVAVATLVVESGGRSAGQDGRMLIRFENHIFFQYWGSRNAGVFNQHFSFAQGQTWTGHHWRPTPNEAWRACHVDDQSVEWDVFQFACGLDDTAAKLSISMGLTQVMGFNHTTLGYDTVQGMFDAFARGPRYQVIGFFDFVRRNGGVPMLQSRDYAAFSRMYNGPGQVEFYAGLIRDSVDEFRRLRGV